MTASTLLFYISVCLVGQVMLGILFVVVRRNALTRAEAVRVLPSPSVSATGAWIGLRTFTVVRREYEDLACTQCSFYLQPADGEPLPEFRPGQFLTFSLAVPGPTGLAVRLVTRCYSLSDSPAADQYRVTIKRVASPADRPDLPPGLSSGHFHAGVQTGDTLQVRAPSGHFYIDAQSQAPVVLIAGGIGITPLMSMLRWCVQHQPQRPVHIYYGLRNSTEHAFKKILEDITVRAPHVHAHVVYSQPLPTDGQPTDYQHPGHIDIALLKRTLPPGVHQFYVCGPPRMMESLVPALSQWGVALADLHFEAFGPASVRLPDNTPTNIALVSAEPLEIYFERSERTLVWNGAESNLLDFAERHGITVESGCRSGSCGSCATTVARGSVTYATPPDYDLAADQCLLCVGRPKSALTLEA